jgi:hypothetical protein
MANVILFTDRSPESSGFDKIGWTNKMYNLPAGAYKVASHLRKYGYSVLVVPNCLGYSFSGLQEIVKNNCKDLLWVGISTTFLTVKTDVDQYQRAWADDSNHIMKDNTLSQRNLSFFQANKQLAWGTRELNLIGNWLKQNYNVPFVIGGAWVTTIKNGNLLDLDNNCFIVSGKAELYVERLTSQRSVDQNVLPEYVNNNSNVKLLIVNRKHNTENKPPTYAIIKHHAQQKEYLSGLYPTGADNTFRIDYKGKNYIITFKEL